VTIKGVGAITMAFPPQTGEEEGVKQSARTQLWVAAQLQCKRRR